MASSSTSDSNWSGKSKSSHKTLETAVIVALGVIIGLGFCGLYLYSQRSETFTIQIQSNTSWSGTIHTSELFKQLGNSTTIHDSGNASYQKTGWLVVVDVQKQTDSGYLTVTIFRAGKFYNNSHHLSSRKIL